MPTITKPKQPVDPYIRYVKISNQDRERILTELLEIPACDEKKREAVIRELESGFGLYFNRLRKLPSRPLPANLIAEINEVLKEIKSLEEAMETLVRRLKYGLTLEAHNRLILCSGVSNLSDVSPACIGLALEIGDALDPVEILKNMALKAIDSFKKEGPSKGGGELRQLIRETREALRIGLQTFYNNNVNDPDEGDREEFVTLCKKYLNEKHLPRLVTDVKPRRRQKK